MPGRFTTSWSLFPPKTTEAQLDERWAFVGKKEAHCGPDEREKGDNWDHVAFDPVSCLVVSFVPGKRDTAHTEALVEDFHRRTEGRPMFIRAMNTRLTKGPSCRRTGRSSRRRARPAPAGRPSRGGSRTAPTGSRLRHGTQDAPERACGGRVSPPRLRHRRRARACPRGLAGQPAGQHRLHRVREWDEPPLQRPQVGAVREPPLPVLEGLGHPRGHGLVRDRGVQLLLGGEDAHAHRPGWDPDPTVTGSGCGSD